MQTREYWEELPVGVNVMLSDTQLMLSSCFQDGIQQKSFRISSIERIEEINELCIWFVCKMIAFDGEELLLVVKCVDEIVQLSIYQPLSDVIPGNREDMLEAGESWLFQEPEDINNFNVLDLQYTHDASVTMQDRLGNEFQVDFFQNDHGPLQGTLTYHPEKAGVDFHLATVVEYTSDSDEADDTLFMIIESGDPESESGGLIRVMTGQDISADSDITIFYTEER